MWLDLEPLYETAQDEAIIQVVADVHNFNIMIWPTLPPFPAKEHNATPSQQTEYKRKMQEWFNTNGLIIPHLQHRIESQTITVYNQLVKRNIYRRRRHPLFRNDLTGFLMLAEVMQRQVVFPYDCCKLQLLPELARIYLVTYCY